MWFLNPVLCQNVSIINVTTEGLGPNNDGCDPECSQDVLIKGCTFNTGDDCIAIKSGRNNDGRRVNVASEDIVIQNCRMKEGHGGVTMGSETSGSIRNVYAENDTMDSPNLQRALRFKTNSVRGGTIENIYARNIMVNQVSNEAIIVDFYYEEGDAGSYTPNMRNLNIENMICNKAQYALWMKGYARSPITNVFLKNCIFTNITNSTNYTQSVVGLQYDSVTINGNVVTSVEKEKTTNSIPNRFELEQNYPNPFNPSTIISFFVGTYGYTSLRVYNLLGQEVAILVNEEKPAGIYNVIFDGNNLSSGIYFCRMQAGGFVATRKLILMK
jgi:polygalacturonase